MDIRPNTPTGARRTTGFATYADGSGGLTDIDMPTYSAADVAAGEYLRAARKELGLSLGDAARATGVQVHEVCDIEAGRSSVDRDAWVMALALHHARTEGGE